jgi:hypothetical protein
MKKCLLSLTISLVFFSSFAQTANDTTTYGNNVVIKDARIAILEKKLYAANTAVSSTSSSSGSSTSGSSTTSSGSSNAGSGGGIRNVSGYRLMVINTSDRDLAMRVRGQLQQLFTDPLVNKLYMSFQMPNTKIEMGNYVDKADADRAKKRIVALKMVNNNVYVVAKTIEVRVPKTEPKKEEGDDKKDEKKDDKKKKTK